MGIWMYGVSHSNLKLKNQNGKLFAFFFNCPDLLDLCRLSKLYKDSTCSFSNRVCTPLCCRSSSVHDLSSIHGDFCDHKIVCWNIKNFCICKCRTNESSHRKCSFFICKLKVNEGSR